MLKLLFVLLCLFLKGIFKFMDVKKIFDIWMKNIKEQELLQELYSIENNPKEIKERFYNDLEFGTAGLRGIMGAGTNRMNIYTVRKATQGLANYLKEKYSDLSENLKVSISFDSRKNSKLFAMETAKVMAGNNIKSFITEELAPTPFLSFSVRYLKTQAGVMITASHNTAEYNGYKCYGDDGAQISEQSALKIYQKMNSVDIFKDIKIMDFEEAVDEKLICFADEAVYEEYMKNVNSQRIYDFPLSNLNVIYTPLNGAGNKFVKMALKNVNVKNLYIVSEQEEPDESFRTCSYPNPENKEAFRKALELSEHKDADIILATDPDSDRLGVCVKHNEKYNLLSGNEVGILLFNYLVEQKYKNGNLPLNPVLIKSIVSTPMVNKIAEKYGCKTIEVLTGFKNIASEILKLQNKKEESRYIFGFEESNGYLTGTYTRDKDAVSASLLICEAASYYKQQGLDLYDVLNNLWNEFGFFGEKTLSFEFKGYDGKSHIKNIMKSLRNNFLNLFENFAVYKVENYLNSKTYDVLKNKEIPSRLPVSNLISFELENNCKIIARPSGTEPKIKFYIMAYAENSEKLDYLKNQLEKEIEDLLKKT